ncbi:hypothetical protein ANN_18089 [Periplaneta americana]|uniref:Guanine nucleotide exchange factor DBS n=1 Tax=Periplaneta americana TaxID=6978 RepID=A0ABQ8SN98_PERAM|nr:hypothetical protein ANN_18089 [Periplaneta americana]
MNLFVQVVVCNCVEELHENVEKSQLTADLGGEIPYCHQEWIQQRVALEKFSCNTQEVSAALDSFTQSLQDTEFPNDVDATQQLLNSQGIEYSELKEEILNAAKHGEDLLNSIRQRPVNSNNTTSTCVSREDQLELYRVCPYRLGNVTAVERLLVQLEETERTFDDFWLSHSARLRQCLELRRFEQDFKELQGNFDSHLKTVCEMTEIGETVARVDTLIREATAFQKLCMNDIERAEELISIGQQLLHSRHYCALDCVQPKCSELQRMCHLLSERLESRLITLAKCRDLQERIDKTFEMGRAFARMGESRNAYRVLVGRPEGKRPLGRPRRRWEDNMKMDLREVGYDDRDWINLAQDRDQWRAYVRAAMNLRANRWCTRGIDLLASQHIEKCSTSPELAEQSLIEIQQYVASAEEFKLSSPKEFRSLFQDSITPETKALVTQVLQRIDDVSMMCEKRMTSLKRLTLKPPRPVQTVTPEPAIPIQQPPGGAPHHSHNHHGKMSSKVFKKANTLPKIEVPSEMWQAQAVKAEPCDTTGSSPDSETSTQDMEMLKTKRGHVLAELLETERVYVTELGSLIKGYKCELQSSEMQSLVPPALVGKADVLFGNLEEIYTFHSDVFLRDLENCISNTELVALCFTQRRDAFLRLYSYYCQNSPRSERLRETVGEKNMFFQACQLKLGHKLPLAAYLLKPVQRITKYQLLLKDLLRYSDDRNCCKELQEALDCMLVVLKCVNDSMHQIAITGFWGELCDQGELLMQGSFSVWTDSKKDRLRELRLKPMQRHIFLYQKAMIFCKKAAKEVHNKDTYHFKRYLKKLLSSSLLSKNLKVRIYKTVILPVVLYGCETWTLTLREEQRLRVFENKVLRKIFGAKRDAVTGEWRKLHNAELHALYTSPDIIRNIKSRRLRWAGHVARMGESRNAYRVLVGRPEGRRPLRRPRRRWEDNIKMDLREVGYDGRDWINLAQDRDRWRAYVRAAMNLRMSQIGLTESVKGDARKFEVWLQGRQEVHTIQALTVQQKDAWVCEIKRVLLEQLAELKGEKIRQYSLAGTGKPIHRPLRQTSSWESHTGVANNLAAFNTDSESITRPTSHPLPQHTVSENGEEEGEGGAWSSDYSNSEDEDTYTEHNEGGGRFTALADYCAMGHSEVSMHEGDAVELLKVGCAGWWYVRVIGSHLEGWAPSAYLEPFGRKSLRSSQSVSSQDGSKSSVVLPSE